MSTIKSQKVAQTIPSFIHRAKKDANYTVMSNYHLHSTNLSLKAIALLSKVLSFPDGWKFSVSGLASRCKESETAIKAALNELKHWGYLKVTKLMPNETNSGHIEYFYEFFEYSEKDVPEAKKDSVDDEDTHDKKTVAPDCVTQQPEEQGVENLPLEKLQIEIQPKENQAQANIDNKVNKNKISMYNKSINPSFSKSKSKTKSYDKQNDRQMDGYLNDQQIYTELIKANIDFPYFAKWLGDACEAEEIVQMIVRQICSTKPFERICGQDFPREVIKSAMLKVDIVCLESVIEQIQQVDDIRNYERYLISTLFNAANTQHFKLNTQDRNAEYAYNRDFGDNDISNHLGRQ